MDALVARIEQRLEQRQAAAPTRRDEPGQAPMLASLGISIPLIAIAGGTTGLGGVMWSAWRSSS